MDILLPINGPRNCVLSFKNILTMKHSTRVNVKPLQSERNRTITTRQATAITQQEKEEMRKKLYEKMKVSEISPIPTKTKAKKPDINAASFTPTQPTKHNLNFDGEILPPTESPARTERKKSPTELEYDEILRRHEEYRKALTRQGEVLNSIRNSADDINSRVEKLKLTLQSNKG